GDFQENSADVTAAVVSFLRGPVEVGGFLGERHRPLLDAGRAAVGVEPGAANSVGPDGADAVAGQPAATPEVAKLGVAQPPGPCRRPAPDVAVGRQVQAGHDLVGDAVAAVERLPPVAAVGGVKTGVGRRPNVAEAVGGDGHNAEAGGDGRLLWLGAA